MGSPNFERNKTPEESEGQKRFSDGSYKQLKEKKFRIR